MLVSFRVSVPSDELCVVDILLGKDLPISKIVILGGVCELWRDDLAVTGEGITG